MRILQVVDSERGGRRVVVLGCELATGYCGDHAILAPVTRAPPRYRQTQTER
jgi:hypothetical protein